MPEVRFILKKCDLLESFCIIRPEKFYVVNKAAIRFGHCWGRKVIPMLVEIQVMGIEMAQAQFLIGRRMRIANESHEHRFIELEWTYSAGK
jgi:hypothetical protein